MSVDINNNSDSDEQLNELEIIIIRLLSRQKAQVHNDASLEDRIFSFYEGWPRDVFIDAVDDIISEKWRTYLEETY